MASTINHEADKARVEELREEAISLRDKANSDSTPSEKILVLRENLLGKLRELRELIKRVEQREIIMENVRVTRLAYRHEEEHPAPVLGDCPICTEPMSHTNTLVGNTSTFSCCGKQICMKCYKDDRMPADKCPMCRAAIPVSSSSNEWKNLRRLAKRGVGTAQTMLGYKYEDGDGVPKKMEEAAKWYRLAAESGCPTAMFRTGIMCYKGVKGVIIQNYVEARRHFKASADLGSGPAQYLLAFMYYEGEGGEVDKTQAAHYFSLAINCPTTILAGMSAKHLGLMFLGGEEGLVKSPLRARYYLQKNIDSDAQSDATVYVRLAELLQQLGKAEMDPSKYASKVCYFMHRAAVEGTRTAPQAEAAAKWIRDYEPNFKKQLQAYCANCWRPLTGSAKKSMKRCRRCKIVSYCSNECEAEHWGCIHEEHCVELE